VFRHTALFLLRETTPDERRTMLQGLASLLTDCVTVVGGDFGVRLEGPRKAGDYDVALHLDFEDPEGYEAYVRHPVHVEVSSFNASLSVEGTTQRLDWRYEGPPRVSPGLVRHCELFTGKPEERLLAGLESAEGVVSALAVADSGSDPRASDWILDVELQDVEAARDLLAVDGYRELDLAVGPRRTARITHLCSPTAPSAPSDSRTG
jgi:hypothetical protein